MYTVICIYIYMYAHVYVHVWIKTHAKKGKGPWISKTIGKWLAAVEIGAFAMQIHAKQQLIVQAVFSRLPRLHSLPYALPSITCYSESCVWTVWTERERERERASLPNRLANHLWRNWAEGRSHPPHFWFPDCLKKTSKARESVPPLQHIKSRSTLFSTTCEASKLLPWWLLWSLACYTPSILLHVAVAWFVKHLKLPS